VFEPFRKVGVHGRDLMSGFNLGVRVWNMKQVLSAAVRVMALLAAGAATAGTERPEVVPHVKDGFSGTVSSANGPEAGVWVIAETFDLGRQFLKIVVTDDQGRYVVPELPPAKYRVWVRGYGLVDSKPVVASPGVKLALEATLAPDAAAAARYYPANYWYALIQPPSVQAFPGTGSNGNGIAETVHTQQDWLALLKDGCVLCHQLGNEATRTLEDNTRKGWMTRHNKSRPLGHRTVGDQGPGMAGFMAYTMAQYGYDRGIEMYANWTRRIAEGALPTDTPPRPSGRERNIVITEWDWGTGRFMHDIISTDRRDPTINANGPIVGAASKHGMLNVFDPKTREVRELRLPIGRTPHDFRGAYPHTLMMDEKRRVWDAELAGKLWPMKSEWPPQPEFCTNGDQNPFADYFPLPGLEDRAIYMYDLESDKIVRIRNCYGGHHLQFGYDKDNTLYFSGDAQVIGWIKTRVWDRTHDPAKSQGWCPLVLDTNGTTSNGYAITPDRSQWNQPGEQMDPSKDTRVQVERFLYGIDVNPRDGSVWAVGFMPSVPSVIYRIELGDNPPKTCVTEAYEPPRMPDGTYAAFGARGVSIDSSGIAWIAFNDGHIGRFDRSKCRVFKGPQATGQQCPQGWEISTTPGPGFDGVAPTQGNTDYLYQSWVDRHDVLGLGKNVPIFNGAMSDSLIAYLPNERDFLTLRIPYPLGFYSRWLDGRIDDQKAGWKGRAYWATYSTMTNWHVEGNEEERGPHLVKLQLRPDPLAH
jgi:hypothetical protein